MTTFEKMLSREKREAFLKRKESSVRVTDEEIALLSGYVLSDACTADIRRLMEGDFFFRIPKLTRLRKGHSNRRRLIYRFADEEAALMKYMAFVLHDYDGLFSDHLYSFRIGKSVSQIFREVSRCRAAEKYWVLKGDIRGFGDHVDPEILCGQLEEILGKDDPQLMCFFRSLLLRGRFYDGKELTQGSTGALSGCALTNFFENIYLLDVDQEISKRAVLYYRFADDIAVFVETQEEAETLYAYLSRVFSERGLEFSEEKTQIVPPGGKFELLGFGVEGKNYDIADSSIAKIEWKLKHRAKKLVRLQQRGKISADEAEQWMINTVDRYFFGRKTEEHELNWVDWSFHVLTRTQSLKRLDACAQDCIRFAGSGGKAGGARYRVRYKKMRRKGYRTLVHAYYHRDELTD